MYICIYALYQLYYYAVCYAYSVATNAMLHIRCIDLILETNALRSHTFFSLANFEFGFGLDSICFYRYEYFFYFCSESIDLWTLFCWKDASNRLIPKYTIYIICAAYELQHNSSSNSCDIFMLHRINLNR